MSVAFAARLFAVLVGGVVAFQLALAAGAPWGHLAMGGASPGRLPPVMRAAAVGQVLLLGLLAAVVLARAGLALPRWRAASGRMIWGVVGYTVLGAVLNAITPSAGERALWLPTTLVLGACAVVVAVRAPR